MFLCNFERNSFYGIANPVIGLRPMHFWIFYKKNLQFSGFGDFRKSTKSWIEKIHFCEVQKIFDFAKMKKSQKLQKKWKTNASNDNQMVISGSLFFGLRPKSPSDPQSMLQKMITIHFY